MISIEIHEPQHLTNPRDVFVVTCTAMIGDGDEFHSITLEPIHRTPGYESQIEELIELLDAMENFRWNDTNSYFEIENFAKWFSPDSDDFDPFIIGGFIATLWSYEITYYDNEGIAHTASIKR